MAEPLRILPPKGEDSVPVFLASGHSVRVNRVDPEDGKEGSIIPSKYHKNALKAGCIYVGAAYDEDEDGGEDHGSAAVILRAVETIVERDDKEELDGAGRPTLKAIKTQAGMNVTRAQLNDAWDAFQESLA